MMNSDNKSSSSIAEEKRKKFASRFSNRNKRRGKKKPNKKELKIEKFWKSFRSRVAAIKTILEEPLVDFEKVNLLQTELMNYFSTNMYYLKPYDKRQGSKQIKELEDQTDLASQQTKSDSKFSFVRESTVSKDEPEKSEEVVKKTEEMEVNFDLTISNVKTGEKKVDNLTKDDFFLISDCEDSTLELQCVSGTGYLKKLRKCNISIGPISRSIFLQNCEDCVIVVACRQFRARDCKRCDFYIHVNSTPVIENSSKIRVAEYNYKWYENVEKDFEVAELNRGQNLWDKIQDFHWQRKEKSPNWSILPTEEGKKK